MLILNDWYVFVGGNWYICSHRKMLAALLISRILWHPMCHFKDIMNEGLFQRRRFFFLFWMWVNWALLFLFPSVSEKTWSLSAEALNAGEPCFNAVDGELAWIQWWRIRCCGVRWGWALNRANPCVQEVFWGSPEVLWTHFGVVVQVKLTRCCS